MRIGKLLIQNRQVPFQVTRQCLPFTKWATFCRPSLSLFLAEFSQWKWLGFPFLIIHVLGFQNATSSATSPKREKLTITKYSQYGYQNSSFSWVQLKYDIPHSKLQVRDRMDPFEQSLGEMISTFLKSILIISISYHSTKDSIPTISRFKCVYLLTFYYLNKWSMG